MDKLNLDQSFRKLIDDTFIRYNGVLIEKSGKGFIALRKYHNSIDEAKDYIDVSFKSLNNKIKQDNGN